MGKKRVGVRQVRNPLEFVLHSQLPFLEFLDHREVRKRSSLFLCEDVFDFGVLSFESLTASVLTHVVTSDDGQQR